MAESGMQLNIPVGAATDLSQKRYHLVSFGAAGLITQSTSPTASTAAGVVQNAPRAGEDATLGYLGKSKVVAGPAISVNALFTTTASGRATTAASGQMVFGRALSASAADGEVITSLLYAPFRWSGAV